MRKKSMITMSRLRLLSTKALIFASLCLASIGVSYSQTENNDLQQAIANPEYMLDHWIELPTAPEAKGKIILKLSLRNAILLALRYNPNIQNAELDRIIQRYQLRLAHNEFELQYALGASANVNSNHFSGVGNTTTQSYLASPELSYKNPLGTQMSLHLDNNTNDTNTYNPLLSFTLTQPLLRGFGSNINKVGLLNAIEMEQLNKLNLKQGVIDQITGVITSYRALILSGNNLENQRMQLEEAKKIFAINEKKIEAGQLEPTGNIQQSYQIESLSLMLEQGENDFKTATQNLLQTIGLDPGLHLSVPSDVTVTHQPIPDKKEAIEIALQHNVQYLGLQMAYRVDKRAYEVAKNHQLWALDLNGNIQAGTTSNVDNTNQGIQNIYNGQNLSQSVQLKLSIPIHDLNRRGELINAKVRLEKDRLNLIAAKRALITEITNLLSNIESLAKRYQLAIKQVKLAQQSYDLEKKKQQAGIASALDVNNTQNQLIQAQSGLISAKVAYLNQISTLERILGTTLDTWKIQLRYG